MKSSFFTLLSTVLLVTVGLSFNATANANTKAKANNNNGKQPAVYDRSADQHPFTVFMQDGGWCWYQAPRAIAHDNKLFIGSVRGHGDGEALVGVYDLKANKQIGTSIMQSKFQRDDHNSPVFYVRPDNKVLAVYARHHKERYHFSRVVDPKTPLNWSEEKKIESQQAGKEKVTYMNLYHLQDEGTLYNFYRFIEFNPTFATSKDHGDTWGDPVHFVQSEVEGRQRPYPRYASNGKDTIFASITDGHPRNFGNSLYYFEFRDGKYFKADGTYIKDLAKDGPIRPSETEMIYQGSMTKDKPEGFESVPNAAWTSSIAIDEKGYPHIGYTLYLSGDDHRYRIASWDGKKWIDREVAYGGNYLYPRESSYTGLITLDPVDPTVVYISTDVHPTTGKDLGGEHEIYKAKITASDNTQTVLWEPVTKNSPVSNLRPVILHDYDKEKGSGKRNAKRIVLWNRGVFHTYANYQLDTVGLIEEVKAQK